jgi:hypothetical protein
MNVPLIVAGSIAVLGAAVHGIGGEVLVVRKLSPATLASSAFGGPRMTRAMIHVTWHLTTYAFLAIGIALLLAGSALDVDAARAIGVLGAAAFTGFGAVAMGLGVADAGSLRSLLRHPGPVGMIAVAALAWWGALTV